MTVRISVNSTSMTEARIVVVRSSTVSILIAGGMTAVTFGSSVFDPLDGVDDIGAGLLVDREQDRGRIVVIGRGETIGRGGDCASDIADPHRRAVAVRDDHVVELLGVGDLVVGVDRETRPRRRQRAFRGVGRCGHQRAADVFQRQPARGELCRIDLHPDRRSLLAAERNLSDARDLRDLLGEIAVGVFVDDCVSGMVSERAERMRIGASAGLSFL